MEPFESLVSASWLKGVHGRIPQHIIQDEYPQALLTNVCLILRLSFLAFVLPYNASLSSILAPLAQKVKS